MTKGELRREILGWREALEPDEVVELSAKVVRNFLTLEEYGRAEAILLYLDFRGEVRTRNLVAASLDLGKTVLVPRVRGHELDPVQLTDPLRGIQPGAFGVPEPTATEVYTGPIDLVLVPAVAYDRRGYRVGYGGGFYDRFLVGRGAASRKVGLAYARQVVDQLPTEDHDVPVDLVVTEVGVVRCHRFRS